MDLLRLYDYCDILIQGIKTFAVNTFEFMFTEYEFFLGIAGSFTVTPFELLTTVFFVVVILRIIIPE